MLKGRFFRNLPVNIFWKSRTRFGSPPNFVRLCLATTGNLSFIERCEKMWRLWWCHKNLFLLKNPKNLYFAWLHGQLFEHGVLNHDEIWYWVPWNVWSCNWYKIWRSKIFEWLCQKCSFLVLFYPLGPQLIPITTKHAQMWSTMLRVWM